MKIPRPLSLATLQLAALLFASLPGLAQETFPQPGTTDGPTPLASEFAEPGGKQVIYNSQYPKSFNYYLDSTVSSHRVFQKLFDSLINVAVNEVDLENHPLIAERWTVSADKKTFTFSIDPKAKWSDGKPVTAHDVAWTFETLMEPKNLTGAWKVMLSRISGAEVIDERTVKFTAKEVHWSSLIHLGGMYILPKHWGEKLEDFNDANFEFPVVSGPYRIKELREPDYIRLERRQHYWRINAPATEGLDNFDIIEFRFYRERETAFDNFRKGAIDTFAVYTSNRWVNETKSERFDKNWIVKQAVYNHHPAAFQGFAMNMRRELFKDKRVRRALAHLVDRRRMNSTIMHNQYALHNSYYQILWGPENPCPNQLVEFDKEKARALLKEAGWVVNRSTGKLEKGGKPFRFTILERSPSFTKFLLIYKEALTDVGIDMKIETTDWSGWVKAMDSYEFDMTLDAWQISNPLIDPEAMWHSKFADLPSNNNHTGFKNEKVDELIEKTISEFDINKRNAIIREIDKILYDETPYVLLWYIDYVRLLYWNKFGTPDQVLSKYEDEEATVPLWWRDPDTEADLQAAMKSGKALPPAEYEVHYDKIFSPSAIKSEPLD